MKGCEGRWREKGPLGAGAAVARSCVWLPCSGALGPGVALPVGHSFISETCPEGKHVLLREALYQGHVIH